MLIFTFLFILLLNLFFGSFNVAIPTLDCRDALCSGLFCEEKQLT